MAYFQINGVDYSSSVNKLDIKKTANYNAQTNAAGNTVVDYINHKRVFDVGIIPLNDTKMKALQNAINQLEVKISYRNPQTGLLESNINCIIPENGVSYYTIQNGNVLYNAFSLQFIEL